MSDVAEANTTSPSACTDKGMRDVAFRKEIRRERSKIAKRVETARVSANVPDLLRLLIAELELWTRELKMETLTLFEDTDHGRYARRMMRNPPPTLSILPGYIMFPFLVVQDARDVVELVVGESQARALANRFETFDGLRRQFGDAVSGLACVWDDAPHTHLEQLVTIDRHRSDLKHAAMDLCRYVDTLANLATAREGGNGLANAAPHLPVALNLAPTTPEDRLRSLRQTFDLAVKRLDSLPDTELSPTGQPFVKECADAMLAFAAWFGEQTPDDVAIHGNAYRVQYALGGLSGVIDWVALHWSVPFAKEIDQETGELVVEADAFDQAVVKAFKVPSKRHELRLTRKPLANRTYDDLEQRIGQIAGLAHRLGSRLQRVAVWASEGHSPAKGNGQQGGWARKRGSGAAGGAIPGALGWQFQHLADGQTNAYHRELCARYAALEPFDLLSLCGKWRELATGFTDDACRSGHHGAHVIHDAAVDRVTRLVETACADRKVEGVGRLSRCLRRPDADHLHWALATLDELEARLRAEAVSEPQASPSAATPAWTEDKMRNSDRLHADGLSREEVIRCIAAFRRAVWEYQDSLQWVQMLSQPLGRGVDKRAEPGRMATRDACGSRNVDAQQKAADTFPVIMRQAEIFGLDVIGLRAAITRNPWGPDVLRDVELLVNEIERRVAADKPGAKASVGGVAVNTGAYGVAVNTNHHGVAVNTARGGTAVSVGDFGIAVSTAGGDPRYGRAEYDDPDRTPAPTVAGADRTALVTQTASPLESPTLPFQIVESAFQVTMDGRTYTFKKRSTKLFQLLTRIARRPGHRVQFDSLRQKGDVWDGYDADDSTIRGAIKRLKDRLRGAKMNALADSISTVTFENRQYVILAADSRSANSN